jgi:hypothetical protein
VVERWLLDGLDVSVGHRRRPCDPCSQKDAGRTPGFVIAHKVPYFNPVDYQEIWEYLGQEEDGVFKVHIEFDEAHIARIVAKDTKRRTNRRYGGRV